MMESRYEEPDTILDLGFLESGGPSWKLQSRFFHSKVGGLPPWLALENLPTDLKCRLCENPLVFLLQIYAPIEEDPSAFHRSVYVFMCRSGKCHSKEGLDPSDVFRIFRSQLSRVNSFYPSDPPVESLEWRADIAQEKLTSLCRICGCYSATKTCSGCGKARYCSKAHQSLDWKVGGHKNECSKDSEVSLISPYSAKCCLPEYELVMEADDEVVSDDEDNEEDEQQIDVKEELAKAQTLDNKEYSAEEVAKVVSNKPIDKTFAKFLKHIKAAPDQVVRYSRGAAPLWISAENTPTVIPNCQYCGAERKFEFQILPQILASLKLEEESIDAPSVDWGVLIVYTCSKYCNGDDGPSYRMEYLFKQNVSHKNDK